MHNTFQFVGSWCSLPTSSWEIGNYIIFCFFFLNFRIYTTFLYNWLFHTMTLYMQMILFKITNELFSNRSLRLGEAADVDTRAVFALVTIRSIWRSRDWTSIACPSSSICERCPTQCCSPVSTRSACAASTVGSARFACRTSHSAPAAAAALLASQQALSQSQLLWRGAEESWAELPLRALHSLQYIRIRTHSLTHMSP